MRLAGVVFSRKGVGTPGRRLIYGKKVCPESVSGFVSKSALLGVCVQQRKVRRPESLNMRFDQCLQWFYSY